MESDELIDILARPEREQLNEFALVLAAQAIQCEVRWDGRRWLLSVPTDVVARARLEVAAYEAEARLNSKPAPEIWAAGRPWPGIYVYVFVLVAMALMTPAMWFGIDWLGAGRIDGQRVLDGEWWRPVTALTLHADAAHLLGNLLFGAFFAYSVSRYMGGGLGWLAIIVSGTLGNIVNILIAGPDHRAIGASTAVFAALGLLSAYLWRRGFPANASNRERFAPVVAGIGLLAFTGTAGENTDIGAHLFGFIAGFLAGFLVAKVGVTTQRGLQAGAAGAAVGIVVVAWFCAIVAAN